MEIGNSENIETITFDENIDKKDKSSVEKVDQEENRQQLLQKQRERYRLNRSAILEKSRQAYMFKKQKQREDHTFTTCKYVKNENEPHRLNRMLSTEVTCSGTCTQHKVKYPNLMNVEIDQPPKKK